MPELPEVETVRRGLLDHLAGRTIESVEVLHPRATRRQPADSDFSAIAGQQVLDVRRRGKYLWFALADGDAVIAHLGMSGQFRFVPPGTPDHPHLRIRLRLVGAGAPPVDGLFLDQRTFGGMQLSPGGAELPAEIAHIGRDLLDPALDRAKVVEAIRRKHVGIKRVLLDQTVTSGIGNIYADEALWAAELHGERLADRLTPAPGQPGARRGQPGVRRGAGRGWHVVRRALRQRQRRVRLLRPLAQGLRPDGAALPTLRNPGPSRFVHEPFLALLPGLPARAPRSPQHRLGE